MPRVHTLTICDMETARARLNSLASIMKGGKNLGNASVILGSSLVYCSRVPLRNS